MTHRLRSSATNFPPTQSQLNYSFLIFRRDDPLSQFHSFVCHFTWWGNKKWHERVGFICTELLNKLSWKVPVAQVLKEIKIFSNPEHPGLSSLICLEVVCIWTQLALLYVYRVISPNCGILKRCISGNSQFWWYLEISRFFKFIDVYYLIKQILDNTAIVMIPGLPLWVEIHYDFGDDFSQ